MIRPEIKNLVALGRFPPSEQVDLGIITQQEKLLEKIAPPISDEEAKELIRLFGPDDYFGGAWSLLHLIETAPGWPLEDCLMHGSNEWILRLRARAERGR
jgi:hypothetical protein